MKWKSLVIMTLILLVIGCGGGSKQTHYISLESLIPVPQTAPTAPTNNRNHRINKYLARPAYNSSTGKVEQVNPMPTFREGKRPNYMNYETGEVYVPVPGPGNSWMNYDGDIIQTY